MEQELISIIVPVYNVEPYLEKCVLSILNQTYRKLEVLLIDDGSSDSSGKICDDLSIKDKRIKVWHIKNSGPSNARNLGIANSNGTYLMFVDADDWLNLNTCEITLNKALLTKAEIVFFYWQKEHLNNTFKEKYFEQNSDFIEKNDVAFLKRRCIGLIDNELNNPVKTDTFNTPWAKLYSTKFLKNSKVFFTERKKVGMEDVLFNIELFQYTNNIALVPQYFYHYRTDNPSSATKTDTENLTLKFINLFNAIKVSDSKHQLAYQNRIGVSAINIMLSITAPVYRISLAKRLENTRSFLNEEIFKNALNQLTVNFMPIHWKVFFFFAKNNLSLGLFFTTYIMRRLR